jgi:hypothetical protein
VTPRHKFLNQTNQKSIKEINMIDNLLDNEIPHSVAESTLPEDKTQTKNTAGKPGHIPEKFWDAKAGEIRVEALLSSYLSLEKRLSNSVDLPRDEDSKAALMKRLGMPETPDEYDVDLSHGLFEADGEVNARLHKCGCTPEQVQEVYNIAAEKLVPMILELSADFQADREVEKLVQHFGGADKWKDVARQLQSFGEKALPAHVLDTMASSYEGVLALYKMMKGEEPIMAADSGASQGVNSADEQDLHSMMKDPKYWRDKNPAYVREVTEGFKRLYSE